MSLAFHVYHPGAKAIFDVTSTLVTGEKDAFLVDAQFQKQYAEELVQLIKDSGKELKVITFPTSIRTTTSAWMYWPMPSQKPASFPPLRQPG